MAGWRVVWTHNGIGVEVPAPAEGLRPRQAYVESIRASLERNDGQPWRALWIESGKIVRLVPTGPRGYD